MPSGRLCCIPHRRGNAPGIQTLTPVAANEQVRTARRALVLLAALVALLATAAPAGAAQSCGRAVIDDWYDDGRVDGTYPLRCYDDAIEILPRDVRDYSSAKDDIQRALQNRMRGAPAPPARTDPTPGETSTAVPEDPDEPTETSATPPSTGTDGEGGCGTEAGGGACRHG